MTTDTKLLQDYSLEILRNYVLVSGLTWYMYDYMLTLPLEISAVWKPKFSGTSILFFTNRYLFMVSCISEVLAHVYITQDLMVCSVIIGIWFISTSLYTIAIWVIFLLRTYAICGRSRLVLGMLLPTFVGKVSMDIWNIHGTMKHVTIIANPDVPHWATCTSLGSSTQSSILSILSIVSGVMIFALTLSRTWSVFRESRAVGMKTCLTALLLRDGSLHFGLVTFLSIFALIISFIYKTSVPLYTLIGLSSPMAAILANRLVLNLRSFGHSNSNLGGVELALVDDPENFKVDVFFRTAYGRRSNGESHSNDHRSVVNTILGNIGEPLRVDDDGDEDEEVMDKPVGIEGST